MDLYQILITHNRMWTLQEIFVFTVIFIVALISVIVLVKMKKIRICQAVSFLGLLIYLALVFASTVFTRNPGAREYQLELFWSWKEIIGIEPVGRLGSCSCAKELLVENFLNMILLFPGGILMPFVMDRKLQWWKGLLIGVLISLMIEILQLVLCRGLFEFDDIIHNSIGCMVGCGCGGCVFSFFQNQHKK